METKPPIVKGEFKPRCRVVLPTPSPKKLVKAVKEAVRTSGFELLEDRYYTEMFGSAAPAEAVAAADCIIADVSGNNANVILELGYAQAHEKPVVLIGHRMPDAVRQFVQGYPFISYTHGAEGLKRLSQLLVKALIKSQQPPVGPQVAVGRKNRDLFVVDWERLNQEDIENLCLELLTQLGYRRVNWELESKEIDIIAELPKKDPDGFEYHELWLVSLGRHMPTRLLLDMIHDEPPDLWLRQILRSNERFESINKNIDVSATITILFILFKPSPEEQTELFHLENRMRRRRLYSANLRIRIWDRNYLTSLIYQFPQIGFKYFSDEGRSRSKYRKTPDELYRENVALSTRLGSTVAALKDEKDKRVRAERDAVWKDISFSAAHKMGNPIFAIETNLDPLQKRVVEHRTDEAINVISSIRRSVEKAKGIVDQFKSLTRAQRLNPVATKVRTLLEGACAIAESAGASCQIECPDELMLYGDPERLGEVFDELICNSLEWFDKEYKQINIVVTIPTQEAYPPTLATNISYISIHFKDNGIGVPVENKIKIFDAFFTTNQHGTGLGLALVRRIIEGHGGMVRECGTPEAGADFELFLPLNSEQNVKNLTKMMMAQPIAEEVNP